VRREQSLRECRWVMQRSREEWREPAGSIMNRERSKDLVYDSR
jgi:hypothetical protein